MINIVIFKMLWYAIKRKILKGKEMNYWFTSDWHLFHKNILKYTNRPFDSVEDMNEAFVEWNNKNVKDDDIVWNLGDLSFGQIDDTIKILKRLKGRHNLVSGNHCRHLLKHKKRLLDEGVLEYITNYKELRIGDKTFILHHFPILSWDKAHHGSYHLFGHTHGNIETDGKSVDVGIDSEWVTGKYEGRPFHLDEVVAYLDRKPLHEYSNVLKRITI